MKFNICTVRPRGYVHSAAFSELAELVAYSLADLGYPVSGQPNHIVRGATNIVIGVHLLPLSERQHLPPDTIVLNTEQISADESRWRDTILAYATQFRVWDYSERNVEAFRARGLVHVSKLDLGFHPKLRRIPKAAEQDIDVLFYGSVGERRQRVLQQLTDQGLRVKAVFGVYGAERDQLIARSRVVMNVHHYHSKIFEIVRAFYLMTNSKALVSECGPDTSIDAAYLPGFRAASYEQIAPACVQLVRDDAMRAELEARALETIRALPQTDLIRPLLSGSGPR